MNNFRFQIAKWTFIGLIIRFAVMPVTMHGQDLFFINYFPMMFVKEGIWDPYVFIDAAFSHFPFTYYGPVLFLIMSIANFIIIKLLNPISLVALLEISSTMMAKGLGTGDYVHAFLNHDLFKNLFLMKSPYLVFDIIIGMFLLKLSLSIKSAITSYKLWMLNPIILHSVYMVGGSYIIPTFFISASLYAGIRKKPYLSIVLLSLGGATMLFPYILILPASFLLGKSWKDRFLLLGTAGLATILIYLPFFLHSGNSVLGLFMLSHIQYSVIAKWFLNAVFIVLYLFVSFNAVRDSHSANPEQKLIYYFTTILFLAYATLPMRFRYFAFITPLLALIMPHNKKFSLFIVFIILILAFQWLTTRETQLGLFAPLNLELLNLPTFQEILGRFVNVNLIYKALTRIAVLLFFVAAGWTWHIKLNSADKEA